MLTSDVLILGDEYLIKRKGWPMGSSTWEPTFHLTPELLRNYEKPKRPSEERLFEAGRQFYAGTIMAALKGKSIAPVYVQVDLDIWRYVSINKGTKSQHPGHTLYGKKDFSRFTTLPENWWYYLSELGEGHVIDSNKDKASAKLDSCHLYLESK